MCSANDALTLSHFPMAANLRLGYRALQAGLVDSAPSSSPGTNNDSPSNQMYSLALVTSHAAFCLHT